MPRFAANLAFMFTEVPFLDRFEDARRAGFTAVEYAFPYQYPPTALSSRLEEQGLQQASINFPAGNWKEGDRGLASHPGREHEFAASVVTALRYAQALKCPRAHVMAGRLPEGLDAEERRRYRSTYVRNLRFAAREAEEQGVMLSIEPINHGDSPNYLLTTQAEAHAIREEVGMPNLRVQFDIYHTQVVEGNVSEKLRRWMPYIEHIQIAGVPGRHEPDIGEINYPYLFRLIDELGYKNWIGCEYRPANGTHAGLKWAEAWGVAAQENSTALPTRV
jgi:hydroxypyruvate isomerase